MSSRSSRSSSRADHENIDYLNGVHDGLEDEENSNDDERHLADGQAKRRHHRKALDIKNNGLSTDGLQVMLDRYNTNVQFIEWIQTGATNDPALILEMKGQTASQIYTRCSKRDSFTEMHVGDDIMATFSTIRDYRAACDMERMDPERFQRIFDQFAAWDEPQYEEFKRNYTLEYVFRRILQRDVRYRSPYIRLLKQCLESTDYAKINRPLLPLPTPKFLTGDSQLELCNSSLRSKLRNMRNRKGRNVSEMSPEAEAFLKLLDEAVNSFFRQVDFVEDSNWRVSSQAVTNKKEPGADPKRATRPQEGHGSRKRSAPTPLSLLAVNDRNKKKVPTMVNRKAPTVPKANSQTNILARAFLRKAFSAPARQLPKMVNVKKEANEDLPVKYVANGFANHSSNGDGQITGVGDGVATAGLDASGHQQPRKSLLSKRPSAFINGSSRKSINKISMMMMRKMESAQASDHLNSVVSQGNPDTYAPSMAFAPNGYPNRDSPQGGSLFGVGVDEPIDEEDLKLILNDLAGMHAVVTCDDFGRVIEHGSIQHPHWGNILVRRSRVVRLGSAQTGFQPPDPAMEFHFPMDQLMDYVPAQKIRFDDDRNLYLNGILTDFYFLQP